MQSRNERLSSTIDVHRSTKPRGVFLAIAVLVLALGAGDAGAQTVCQGQPWLGSNGPELCVNVFDDGTGTSIDLRGPSPIVINRTVGDYRLNLVVTFEVSPTGMGVSIEGPVRRTSAGTGGITVRADGATDTSIPSDTGSLWLEGTASAASNTHLGGGAGYRHNTGDVEFRTFVQTCDETTYHAGDFECEITGIPVNEGGVGVTNITSFHVNDVDDSIVIPSWAAFGNIDPPDDWARAWSEGSVGTVSTIYEIATSYLDPPWNTEVLVTNIEVERQQNTLNGYVGTVQCDSEDGCTYEPVEVVEPLDSGFVMGAFTNCPLAPGDAVVPYIKGVGSVLNVWVAELINDSWSLHEVEESPTGDHHWAVCFNTSQGNYVTAYNFSTGEVEIYQRTQSGGYTMRMALDEGTLGAPPSGWFSYPDTGDYYHDTGGWYDYAVVSVPLDDGSLAAVQLNTDPLEVVGVWNAGQANGDTSVDISMSDDDACHRASMNWMDGQQLWHANWCVEDGPSSAQRFAIATVEQGTEFETQGVDGGMGSDGAYNLLVDKHYVIDQTGALLPEVWSYPPRTQGGPLAYAPGGPEGVDGVAAWRGSQMVGVYSTPEPQNSFAVPAVARVRGSGAFFTSVMHLLNSGDTDMELEMTFTPRQGSGGQVKTVSHTVPAGVMQTIDDVLQSIFRFGGSAGRVGSILVKVLSGSKADLMMQTVVFAELDSGEAYGQFFPANTIADAIAAGETVYLNTTENPNRNRVNVGLMAVADGTRFRVRPVDPLGAGLAPWRSYDLNTGGNTQINNIHSTFGLGSRANVVIEVEVVSGQGFAYASVLDGSGSYEGTSDPTTIQPVTGGRSKVTLLEIGSIQGLNEFSGSASITNYSNKKANIRAEFYQRGEAGPTATETLSIPAGDTIGYSDLGADLFGVSGDVGTVVLAATNGTRIGATGREFAIFRNGGAVVGTAGQLIAGQANSERLEPETTYAFIGLRQTRGGGAKERSHFAAFNPGELDAEVTVKLFDGATGNSEGERTWVVPAGTLIQVNNVIKGINSGYDNREKWIEVEVDQKVFMNAFRVNEWGDPVTLNPFPKNGG